MLVSNSRGSAATTRTHFSLMDTEDLVRFHVDDWRIEHNVGNYYRYLPDQEVQHVGEVCILRLPHWSSKGYAYQQTSLSFATFDQRRLDVPAFRSFVAEGLGTMTFNQLALEEFVTLLKQRTYANFVRGMQAQE